MVTLVLRSLVETELRCGLAQTIVLRRFPFFVQLVLAGSRVVLDFLTQTLVQDVVNPYLLHLLSTSPEGDLLFVVIGNRLAACPRC